jgi:hypothetical protein
MAFALRVPFGFAVPQAQAIASHWSISDILQFLKSC